MCDPAVTTPQQITERVLRSFDGCPDDRLRELMQALVAICTRSPPRSV